MRRVLVVSIAIALAAAAAAGEAPVVSGAELHPDKIEMTTYYVGFLFRGPAWTPEVTPATEQLQRDHLANIARLAREGHLVLAGPFTDGGDLRGMFVFRVASLEEARALCDTDPAVKAGRLRVELHPWYSAKGIGVLPSAARDSTRGAAEDSAKAARRKGP